MPNTDSTPHHSSPAPVSLPSIRVMFPEHLARNQHSPVDPSAHRPYSMRTESLLPISAHDLSVSPTAPYAHNSTNPPPPCDSLLPHLPGPSRQSTEHETTRHNHLPPQITSSPTSRGHYDHPYAFDILRSNPLTANLESVLPISDPSISFSTRDVPMTALELHDASQPTIASMRKVRPAFRVYPPKQQQHHSSAGAQAGSSKSPNTDVTTLSSSVHAPRIVSFHPPVPVDDKRHCCPHCDKRFNRPSSLSIHVNTHTGAKPFRCVYPGCDRKFNVNSNMRRHWRNHLSSRRRENGGTQTTESASSAISRNPSIPARIQTSPSATSSPSSSRCSSPTSSPRLACLPEIKGDLAMVPELGSASRRAGSATSRRDRRGSSEHDSTKPHLGRTEQFSLRPDPYTSSALPYSDSSSIVIRHRPRSCSMAGCDCQPITSSLRPAFPDQSSQRPQP